MPDLQQRLTELHLSLTETARKSGRTEPVRLLAVSKTFAADLVEQAWQAGQRDFGESYVQEAVAKIAELAHLDGLVWHFIGPLQANKARLVAEHFQWMHSIDRLKIARRLSALRPPHLPPLNICLQINIDRETSKSGFDPEQLCEAVAEIALLPRLRLRGLMALPARRHTFAAQQRPFKEVAALFDRVRRELPQPHWNTLSMGMSGDMMAAVAQGATIVRIGTALFGQRFNDRNSKNDR